MHLTGACFLTFALAGLFSMMPGQPSTWKVLTILLYSHPTAYQSTRYCACLELSNKREHLKHILHTRFSAQSSWTRPIQVKTYTPIQMLLLSDILAMDRLVIVCNLLSVLQ